MWTAFIISLTDSHDRIKESHSLFASLGIGYKVFNAVDGRSIQSRLKKVFYDAGLNRKYYKTNLSDPEIGCYLSHRGVWQRIVDENLEGAFIFEDDFLPAADLMCVLNSIQKLDLPPFIAKLNGQSRRAVHGIADLSGQYRLVKPSVVPGRTTAYAISRAAAETLLKRTLPIYRPIDVDFRFWWQLGVDVYLVQPAPVSERPSSHADSTIEAARRAMKPQALPLRLHRWIRHLTFQAGYRASLICALAFERLLSRPTALSADERTPALPLKRISQ
jgi:glycosyl transferase family 25